MVIRKISALLALSLTFACGKEPVVRTETAPVDTATIAATASVATTPPIAPAPAAHDAEALIAQLYREHDAERSPFFQTKERALVDAYFERTLADAIWKDVVEANGEVGALDFDPLYDGQDVEPKNLVVHPAQITGEQARVLVTFESYGEKRQLTWVLVPVSGAWKISNAEYGEGRTLGGVYAPVS